NIARETAARVPGRRFATAHRAPPVERAGAGGTGVLLRADQSGGGAVICRDRLSDSAADVVRLSAPKTMASRCANSRGRGPLQTERTRSVISTDSMPRPRPSSTGDRVGDDISSAVTRRCAALVAVPEELERRLRETVARWAVALGESPESCRRAVEMAVLQRGVEAMGMNLQSLCGSCNAAKVGLIDAHGGKARGPGLDSTTRPVSTPRL